MAPSSTSSNGAAAAANEAFFLALLTAGGGLTGYIRAQSIPSLAAGLTVGALYALGAQRIRTSATYGVELALLASVILAGSSIPRAIRTGGTKPLPLGLSVVAAYGCWRFGGLRFGWATR